LYLLLVLIVICLFVLILLLTIPLLIFVMYTSLAGSFCCGIKIGTVEYQWYIISWCHILIY